MCECVFNVHSTHCSLLIHIPHDLVCCTILHVTPNDSFFSRHRSFHHRHHHQHHQHRCHHHHHNSLFCFVSSGIDVGIAAFLCVLSVWTSASESLCEWVSHLIQFKWTQPTWIKQYVYMYILTWSLTFYEHTHTYTFTWNACMSMCLCVCKCKYMWQEAIAKDEKHQTYACVYRKHKKWLNTTKKNVYKR